ncbi:nuclear fragile X mental retardation-interacting protein 1-like [Haliotis rufescens]|uniref:nuclear fragile X mental retardation-interacting protein 1-like n=1 Tax=Haliotis rufescens TaxID=6454 RepID=UPI00201EDB14|nr:nuclear fragile X mental retardation-interacting protein 1-like [Haliotis rufescens]
MNHGYGYNTLDQYGHSNPYSQQNGMFNQQAWNHGMNRHQFPPGQFPGPAAGPWQYPPRGPRIQGPGMTQGHNSRPQFQQRFGNHHQRHNNPYQNPHKNPHNVTNAGFQNANFHNVPNDKKKNKKKRIDKRDLPENNQFFCDTCDRGFCSDEKYQEHAMTHEKCSDPTCSYVAAPKLVKLHFQMQHQTGLAHKIWQLESPQDIKKWIEERKRNFPTAANVARKKTVEADRRSRGEKLDTKYFGKMKGGKHRGKWGNRKRGFDDAQSDVQHSPAKKTNTTEQTTPANGDLKTVDPLAAILMQPGSETGTDTNQDQVNVAGGLASLMASYGADSETEEGPHTSHVKSQQNTSLTRSCGNNQTKTDSTQKPMSNRQRKQQRKQNGSSKMWNTKRSTLLERLLAKEIRHERNVLLQCVHYIVKKKFFGVDLEGKKNYLGSR